MFIKKKNFAEIMNITNDIKFIKFFKLNENKANMNNANINLEVENSVEDFLIIERKNIINI